MVDYPIVLKRLPPLCQAENEFGVLGFVSNSPDVKIYLANVPWFMSLKRSSGDKPTRRLNATKLLTLMLVLFSADDSGGNKV